MRIILILGKKFFIMVHMFLSYIAIFHWLPLAITLTVFLIPVVKLIHSRKVMKLRWKPVGSEMISWICNTTSISEKSFEQKLKCAVGCKNIHLLQLLKNQLGFWQSFVDKDPILPWHQFTVDSKDSLNKVLRLQPLRILHIYMSTRFGSEPAMTLFYNTRKAYF